MTELQNKILKYMRSMDTYNLPMWGFSAIGYRELAKILDLKPITVSNSMRALLNKGVFYMSRAKNQYDDTTYFLKNPNINKNLNNETN